MTQKLPVTIGCKSRVYRRNGGAELLLVDVAVLRIGVGMEMLLLSNRHLLDSPVALVIDVRNMWEVFMEGSHTSIPHNYLGLVI
jgi:hypothetical protein